MAVVKAKDLHYVSFLDPGSGKSKDQLRRRSARSAIVTIAYDWFPRIFVRHAWAGRVDTNVLYDKVLEQNRIYQPVAFGIEANAQQSLFVDQFINRCQREGVRVPIVGINQSTKIEKTFRIRSAIQPKLGMGQLFIDEKDPAMLELIAEMSTFPMSPTVDLVDALASAISLVPQRSPRRELDDELKDRLQYLRERGAPPHYIERVARGEL